MAGRLVQASIDSPGFLGLNTEQQSAQSREGVATELTNAVFDQTGRISSRNGWDATVTHTESITELFWWRKDRTTAKLMAVADDEAAELYEVTQTTNPYDTMTKIGDLADLDTHFANCNGFLCCAAQGFALKYWDGTTFANFAAATGTTANPTGGVIFAGFGRLFVSSADGTVLYGSELQPNPSTGIDWDNWFIDITGSTGGSAKDGFVVGADFLTGACGIGDLLFLLGTNSIMQVADVNGDPAVVDSITGVGCVSQKTIRNVGDDILFLSSSGVRSMLRTFQKETPSLNDISAFVRGDLLASIEPSTARCEFSELDGFYVISDGSECYMFDLRQQLPGGARRTSLWTLAPDAWAYDPEDNQLFVAVGTKIGIYQDWDDDGSSYKLTLKSAWLDLSTNAIKIIKKLGGIFSAGDGYTPVFTLGFDYQKAADQRFSADILPSVSGDEWGLGEWNIAEWSQDADQLNRRYVQGCGNGLFVRYGVEFTVDGFEVGIQEIQMTAKLGKLAHV